MSAPLMEAEEFGGAVRRWRERHGWSRPEMVMRLRLVDPEHGWTTNKLTNVERGAVRHPPIKMTRILSTVLGCEVDDLVWPSRSGCYGDMPPEQELSGVWSGANNTLAAAA